MRGELDWSQAICLRGSTILSREIVNQHKSPATFVASGLNFRIARHPGVIPFSRA